MTCPVCRHIGHFGTIDVIPVRYDVLYTTLFILDLFTGMFCDKKKRKKNSLTSFKYCHHFDSTPTYVRQGRSYMVAGDGQSHPSSLCGHSHTLKKNLDGCRVLRQSLILFQKLFL